MFKSYLIAFNAVSAVGWAAVLFLTLSTLADRSTPLPSDSFQTNDFSRKLVSLVYPYVPPSHSASWSVLAPVQSLAALEVLHSLFGLVHSAFPTTLMQVFSRLFLVWAIVARFPSTHLTPFYTTMVLAWSIAEVPRYTYYVLSLMTRAPPGLTWLRYTAFYVLYPLGAASEAFIVLSTIPEWKNNQYLNWNLEALVKAVMLLVWTPSISYNSPWHDFLLTPSARLTGPVRPYDADAVESTWKERPTIQGRKKEMIIQFKDLCLLSTQNTASVRNIRVLERFKLNRFTERKSPQMISTYAVHTSIGHIMMWYRVLKIDIARGFPCKLAYQSKTICASHSSIQEHDTTREISMGGFSAPGLFAAPM